MIERVRIPARLTARAPAALVFLAVACGAEAPAPAPPPALAPAPAVVVIPAVESAATSAPDHVTVATAEPTGAASAPSRPPSQPIRFDRWRTAVEKDTPAVQPGNITALNAARVPFARYLKAMHDRIHPLFADQFLGTLSNLPKGHPLGQELSTHLEIVLAKDTGKLVRMGVIKSSGVTAFDVGVLDAVDRAAPFGKAPDVIASPDGNVYVHWELHRDPVDACSTRNARPFILKAPP